MTNGRFGGNGGIGERKLGGGPGGSGGGSRGRGGTPGSISVC